MITAHNWTEDIEHSIISLFIQDPQFATHVMGNMKSQHFSPPNAVLFGAIYEYFATYGGMPSDTAIFDFLCHTIGEKDAQFLRPRLMSLFRPVSDAGYVRDRVTTFLNLRNLEDAVRRAGEYVLSGRYEEARGAVFDFKEVGASSVIEYFSANSEVVDAEAIPTGIHELDGLLRGGGHQRRRLGVVLAGTSVGKSALLLNFGANAVKNGYKVLHLTIEDTGAAVKRRYDSRFACRDVRDGMTDDDRKMIWSVRSFRGSLHIQEMMSGASPSAVRMAAQAMGGARPDILIVDHIDVMKSDSRREEKRFEHEDIATSLRSIAQEFDCAVWTGKQGDRRSRQSEYVTGENSAESYGPIRVADVVVAVSRPAEDRRNRRMTLWLDKQRDGEAGRSVVCTENLGQMLIQGIQRATD